MRALRGSLLVMLPGCASGPAPTTPAHAVPGSVYEVQAGDQLRIGVWPDSALGGVYPVENDGAVYLPLVGRLEVAGMPLSELRQDLRGRYGQEMRSPTVSVTPLFRVSVLGAVQRPGLYEVTPTQGVMDAIGLAGGFREEAKTGEVQLVREDRTIVINAEPSLAGQAELVDGLRSGDRIVVPRGWNIEVRDVLYGLQSLAILVTLIIQMQDEN